MANLKKICKHGKRVWGNYGDGKVRHFADDQKTPLMDICEDFELETANN